MKSKGKFLTNTMSYIYQTALQKPTLPAYKVEGMFRLATYDAHAIFLGQKILHTWHINLIHHLPTQTHRDQEDKRPQPSVIMALKETENCRTTFSKIG